MVSWCVVLTSCENDKARVGDDDKAVSVEPSFPQCKVAFRETAFFTVHTVLVPTLTCSTFQIVPTCNYFLLLMYFIKRHVGDAETSLLPNSSLDEQNV
jgi:hypothetical protein